MKISLVGLAVVSLLAVACSGAAPDEEAADQTEADLVAAAPIANFHKVRPGLYRGGHPDGKGLDYLKKLGVKTIVDLEVGDFVEAFPWDIAGEVDGAKSRHLTLVREPMSAFEPAVSDDFDAKMNAIQKLLADPTKAPVYVHCKHGQDRTGLVIGLERVEHEHWAPKDAYAEMLKLGFHPLFEGLNHYFEEKTGFED